MSESKHTPGPWYVGNSMNPADRPFGICREIPSEAAGLSDDDGPGEETIAEVCPGVCAEADARLIAAAPDLLRALGAIVDALDSGDLTLEWSEAYQMDSRVKPMANLDAARAAIRRARGEA